MTEHRFTDRATMTGARRTNDGYLVAEAFVARAGIQLYRGSEVGLTDRDVVRVWRPEAEVMAADSVRTYTHAPITLGHPDVMVDSQNWKELAKGEVSTEAEWQDGKLRLPLIVKDADAIAAIDGGTRELSAGYTCDLDFEDGFTSAGEAYNAIQRRIRINHLAIVPKGRAGSEFRIGDTAKSWGIAPITLSDKKEDRMSDALKTVVLGDKAVQVATTDVAAVEAWKADTAKRLVDAETGHAKELAAKDAELAAKDAEIASIKGKVLDAAALDKMVADRADLVAKAKAIAPDVKAAGLSDAAIRKAVVVAKLGDAMADKADAYIDARFEILTEDAQTGDPVRDALKDGKPVKVGDRESIYAARDQALESAWMDKPIKKEA